MKGSKLWLEEDFPPRIREARKTLLPAFLTARKSHDVKNCKLSLDKLWVDGKVYTMSNVHELPIALRPTESAVRETEEVVIFASNKAIFSNLYGCKIDLDGQSFNSAEQYIQLSKAKLFNDKGSEGKIMSETDSYEQMKLGKAVRNFDKDTWHQKAKEILRKCNLAKYNQNAHLREALIKTGSKKLGEATAHPYFGIGHRIKAKEATDTDHWSGKNVMETIREEIKYGIIRNM